MSLRALLACILLWSPSAFAFPTISAKFDAVGGLEAHKQTVEDAIDSAAKQFNFLVRGLAKSRLRETNPVFALIEVDYEAPPTLRMASESASLALTGTNLESHPFTTPKGEAVTVNQTIEANRIKREFYTKTGRRSVTYILDESHETLTLIVSVSSEYMASDLTYELLYRVRSVQ